MTDRLERLLRGIPREPAPEIPLETLFDRAAATRWRLFGLGAIAAAATLLLALLLTEEPREAPVHLRLKVVTMEAEEESSDQPVEFDRP